MALRVVLLLLVLLPLATSAQSTTLRPGAVPALSYCAHWYARSGNACINDASADSQISVVWDDAASMQTAITRCKAVGCKINFYCEAMYTGNQRCDIPAITATYSRLVAAHGKEMFLPMLEIDAIRDIPQSRATQLLQSLKSAGWSLVLKNSAAISTYSQYAPIARVVYEDLVNNTEYAAEFKQLAQSNPKLLLTGIVHQGGYDGDKGASLQQAQQRFLEYAQFKNVELFYGQPSSYQKVKSFDGGMQNIAEGIGPSNPTTQQTQPAPALNPYQSPLSRPNLQAFAQPITSTLSPLTSGVTSGLSAPILNAFAPESVTPANANSAPNISVTNTGTIATTATGVLLSDSLATSQGSISPTNNSVSGTTTYAIEQTHGATFGSANDTRSAEPALLSAIEKIIKAVREILQSLTSIF